MKLDEVLKILLNEKLTIDYLGYNETKKIIDEIKSNPKLIEQIEKIPNNFWEEAKQDGLLVYSDTTWTTSRSSMKIENKYQDEHGQGKKHLKALVLEKRIRR